MGAVAVCDHLASMGVGWLPPVALATASCISA